jgi:hypothetical protein
LEEETRLKQDSQKKSQFLFFFIIISSFRDERIACFVGFWDKGGGTGDKRKIFFLEKKLLNVVFVVEVVVGHG